MIQKGKMPFFAIVAIVAEVGLGAYVAFVVWLLSAFMVDDSVALRMAAADWYIEAGKRVAIGVLVAVLFTAITYQLNRRWLTESPESIVLRGIAPALGICIALASIVGAVDFAIRKPFM